MKRLILVSLLACLYFAITKPASASELFGPSQAIENFYVGEKVTALVHTGSNTWIAVEGTEGVYKYNHTTKRWSHSNRTMPKSWTVTIDPNGNGGIWAGSPTDDSTEIVPEMGWESEAEEAPSLEVISEGDSPESNGEGLSVGIISEDGNEVPTVDTLQLTPRNGTILETMTDAIRLSNGELWVAADKDITNDEGGVAYYNGTVWMDTSASLYGATVRYLAEGFGDRVYAATSAGVFTYNRVDAAWSFYGLEGIDVRDVAVDNGGRVWAATMYGLFVEAYPGEWMPYSAEIGLAGDNVTKISIDQDNTVWAATDTGLSRIVVQAREATAIKLAANHAVTFSMNHQVQIAAMMLVIATCLFLMREVNRPIENF